MEQESQVADVEFTEMKEKRDIYEVKKGFVKVQVLRGITEISPVMDLVEKTNGKAFVCGGYVRYCCSPMTDPVKAGDCDLYFMDNDAFEEMKLALKIEGLSVKHENENAITYSRPETGKFAFCPVIQLIKPGKRGAIVAVGTMEEILSAFDFTVIRAALVSRSEALVDANFAHDEERKFLRILNIHCPISSTLRFMKYAKKGYWSNTTEVFKLFLDWDRRDEKYREDISRGINEISQGNELSEEEIDQLEKLMNID